MAILLVVTDEIKALLVKSLYCLGHVLIYSLYDISIVITVRSNFMKVQHSDYASTIIS